MRKSWRGGSWNLRARACRCRAVRGMGIATGQNQLWPGALRKGSRRAGAMRDSVWASGTGCGRACGVGRAALAATTRKAHSLSGRQSAARCRRPIIPPPPAPPPHVPRHLVPPGLELPHRLCPGRDLAGADTRSQSAAPRARPSSADGLVRGLDPGQPHRPLAPRCGAPASAPWVVIARHSRGAASAPDCCAPDFSLSSWPGPCDRFATLGARPAFSGDCGQFRIRADGSLNSHRRHHPRLPRDNPRDRFGGGAARFAERAGLCGRRPRLRACRDVLHCRRDRLFGLRLPRRTRLGLFAGRRCLLHPLLCGAGHGSLVCHGAAGGGARTAAWIRDAGTASDRTLPFALALAADGCADDRGLHSLCDDSDARRGHRDRGGDRWRNPALVRGSPRLWNCHDLCAKERRRGRRLDQHLSGHLHGHDRLGAGNLSAACALWRDRAHVRADPRRAPRASDSCRGSPPMGSRGAGASTRPQFW